MIIQGINISRKNAFDYYANKYSIFKDLFDERYISAVEFRNVPPKIADSLKTNILEFGFLCYKRNSFINNSNFDLLVLAEYESYFQLIRELARKGAEEIGRRTIRFYKNILNYDNSRFVINNKTLDLSKGVVMGILNTTPDSFYDGGKYCDLDTAIKRAEQIVEEGGEIIDIGGESSRPGSARISDEEEIKRVIPVVREIRKRFSDAFISVDTYKYKVAYAASDEGCDFINDIYACRKDERIFSLVASKKIGLILMHMKGDPENMQNSPYYDEPISEIYDFLYERTQSALKYEVENIIVDPGIGFGKRVRDNLEIINRIDEFKGLGYPILIGLSNKSFLGKLFDLDVNQREIPTIIAETISLFNGAKIIRTHNVKNAVYLKKFFSNLKELPAF